MTDPLHAAAPQAAQPDLSLARIQQYVWARYVEFEPAPFELDEEQALALLDAHYQRHPLVEDSECFYYGILAYERSFAADPPLRSLLSTARRAFEAYRAQTEPGFTWDAVEDRYADVVESLEERSST